MTGSELAARRRLEFGDCSSWRTASLKRVFRSPQKTLLRIETDCGCEIRDDFIAREYIQTTTQARAFGWFYSRDDQRASGRRSTRDRHQSNRLHPLSMTPSQMPERKLTPRLPAPGPRGRVDELFSSVQETLHTVHRSDRRVYEFQ